MENHERWNLGKLADAKFFTEALTMKDENHGELTRSFRLMNFIRKAEEKIGDMVAAAKIICPCHLAIGQEAIAVGVCKHLNATDQVFGTHRSHSHFLAMGGSALSLFAEVLGKSIGSSKGMGGSMHLYDGAKGFAGSVPIVAATVPLAVGAGLAAKLKERPPFSVGVCFFGDGATEEGVVHESLNLAQIYQIPVLFVCENNLFSSHLHIHLRQPKDSVARFAEANCIKYETVDGNDVLAVERAADRLLQYARSGKGPVFLEAVTYRWRGHVGPREDIDVGVRRKDDLHLWKMRDPILRMQLSLLEKNILTTDQIEKIHSEIENEINIAWQQADEASYPSAHQLLDCVYTKEV